MGELKVPPELSSADHRNPFCREDCADLFQVITEGSVPNTPHERPLRALGSQQDTTLGPLPQGSAEFLDVASEHGGFSKT
eukprot:10204239-Alexandrium_andersonii.AAC.1